MLRSVPAPVSRTAAAPPPLAVADGGWVGVSSDGARLDVHGLQVVPGEEVGARAEGAEGGGAKAVDGRRR